METLSLFKGYCIDTSALIDLWRMYYPPDVFETLWREIESLIYSDELVAPKEVLKELRGRDDELLRWAKGRRSKKMFKGPTKEQIEWTRTVVSRFPQLVDPLASTPSADPFVVALAVTQGLSVVTSEKPGGGKPKIPDVCKACDIKCLSLLGWFREKGWRF